MSEQRIAPYGNWSSPISAILVASQSYFGGIEHVILDSITSKVYFAQKRPEENGRSAIVDASNYQDVFDKSWDARTGVHEYGGAAAIVFRDVLYFSNYEDGRVYKSSMADYSHPEPITLVNKVHRFADFAVHPTHSNFIVSIVEDHTEPHPAKVITTLQYINDGKSIVSPLVQGADFYSCPRFSPDGKFLVWQQWSGLGKVLRYSLHHASSLRTDSHFNLVHPCVSRENMKRFLQWIRTGHRIIACFSYRISAGTIIRGSSRFELEDLVNTGKASPILPEPLEEEFGAPQWWLSRHGSGALSSTQVAFVSFRHGKSKLYVCDITKGALREIPTPYAHIQYVHGNARGRVVMLGQPANAGEELANLLLDEAGEPILRPISLRMSQDLLSPSLISVGQYYELTLPPDNRTCHVIYYPPKNPDYDGGLPGEKPPVVVLVHGGPFYMEPTGLDFAKQFFTSRGWAHVDVNYAGSTGFGRKYREHLHGKWGVLEVDDAHQSIVQLDAMGLLDSKRAVIHGGSAGGYTTLQVATTLGKTLSAGAPSYGISEMRELDKVLHKFEYYLCDRLIGRTYEDMPDVWKERSPIYHVNRIKMPLLVLQGALDTVIPAEKMIEMVEIIKRAGGKAELVLFENEGHGWRHAKSTQVTLEKELSFFNEVLGLENTA